MSAETQHQGTRMAGGLTGAVVQPEPITDRGLLDNVTDYISDIVPQVHHIASYDSSKDSIQWARIETHHPSGDLMVILGHVSGVTVWALTASGEAKEVLWRRGAAHTFKLLPDPSTRDLYAHKRPLIAINDSSCPGPQYCSLGFISLRTGDQLKLIKYKNPVNEVLCSSRVVIVTFPSKLAILDAGSLEERRAIVTCYPVSGPNLNPVALGSRWLAYAERRLSTNHLSGGGAEACGTSVKATVLHAAKSLGKAVASSLAGQRPNSVSAEDQPGVVSVIDVEANQPEEKGDDLIAHFVAHTEPLTALSFDPTGILLLTADKRGHDFHVFRMHPHPRGAASAAVHHLYVLHRGDTAAKVQHIAWTLDSRWVAVSTLRGTTHVFGLALYGGPVTARTHLGAHVVNRQSRFHRSAGLIADGRNSPESHNAYAPHTAASPNPRMPPFPHPHTIAASVQLRVPQTHTSYDGSASGRGSTGVAGRIEEVAGYVPVRVAAGFWGGRGGLAGVKPAQANSKGRNPLHDHLYIISTAGIMIEYSLTPRISSAIPKEKHADDSPVELVVEAKAQWGLFRATRTFVLQWPLHQGNPLMREPLRVGGQTSTAAGSDEEDELWMSQVEITTHIGPHRRLWMGPQFIFKTFAAGGSKDAQPVDVGSVAIAMNMMQLGNSGHPPVPVLLTHSKIEGSYNASSLPRIRAYSESSDGVVGDEDTQLAESLADAMIESPTELISL